MKMELRERAEKELAEELADHMSIGMGAKDVLDFLGHTGQREGWMWSKCVELKLALRSQREAAIRECAEIADNASGENAQSYDGGGWDCACGAIEGRILALLKTKGGDDE